MQGRNDEAPNELVTRVDDVRADGAERQRAFAYVGKIVTLTDVNRDRDDFGLGVSRQLPNRERGLEPARIRHDNALHKCPSLHLSRPTSSLNAPR